MIFPEIVYHELIKIFPEGYIPAADATHAIRNIFWYGDYISYTSCAINSKLKLKVQNVACYIYFNDSQVDIRFADIPLSTINLADPQLLEKLIKAI